MRCEAREDALSDCTAVRLLRKAGPGEGLPAQRRDGSEGRNGSEISAVIFGF
jgi:hypothetical protein